jgi:hypothetical protein
MGTQSPDLVILNAVKNLVLHRDVAPSSWDSVTAKKGGIWVPGDEHLHCVQYRSNEGMAVMSQSAGRINPRATLTKPAYAGWGLVAIRDILSLERYSE